MDRTEAIWRWAQGTGLYMQHKDLRPEQILRLYNKTCVPSGAGRDWIVVDKPDKPERTLRSYFSKTMATAFR